MIAKAPKESSKTIDIVGGLPRVIELFEARKPKESAVMAEATGVVSFGRETLTKIRLTITPDQTDSDIEVNPVETLIPKARKYFRIRWRACSTGRNNL